MVRTCAPPVASTASVGMNDTSDGWPSSSSSSFSSISRLFFSFFSDDTKFSLFNGPLHPAAK